MSNLAFQEKLDLSFENDSTPSFWDKEIRGSDWDYLRLRDGGIKDLIKQDGEIGLVDLFAGCGGLTLGITEAARALGTNLRVLAAVESNKPTADCFEHNFKAANVIRKDIKEILNGELGSRATDEESKFIKMCHGTNILIGGPPCQGHSDLNNFTRRKDSKNMLYLSMIRAAELISPELLLIENVIGAKHDTNKVVQKSVQKLKDLGYYLSVGIISGHKIGVPQRRRRYILLASKNKKLPQIEEIEDSFPLSGRDVEWAIGDLRKSFNDGTLMHELSKNSKDNVKRINYLFENGVYDLPNTQRPPCHRKKKHSYNSIYGRLKWNEPSQTITSGFYCNCMGRYVHPERKSTLTAHEAARLQFFPDFFNFEPAKKRTQIAQIIGNSVPPKLSYCCGLALLNTL